MISLIETEKEEFTNAGRIDLVAMQGDALASKGAEILSEDPLVYVVSNFLTKEECEAYQEYVKNLDDRNMTRSNPPAVSLDVSRLWPLPLLSLFAGIPPVLHLMEEQPTLPLVDTIRVALPNVAVALAASGVLAYGVVLPLVRQIAQLSSRTSVAVALNTEVDHPFVRRLVEKVTTLTKHPWTNWEAPVVTRYDPGAVFSRHGDASPIRGEEWKDKGGQRVITCICYLNTLCEGGETHFDRLNIAVQPEAGKALFFFPADGVTWIADDRTTHESKPPINEDKWIVQMFGRAQRVPPPLGLVDSFGSSDSKGET
jgi:prolyl 4-hydroxylase